MAHAINAPAGYLRRPPPRAGSAAADSPIAPLGAVMLFLADTDADEPDTAARDAALDLGQRLHRPVLLLDAGCRANGQLDQLRASGALAARPPHAAAPTGCAALHFHRARDGCLFVSAITPPEAAGHEAFWQRLADDFPAVRRRLLQLFGAVVIACPGLSRSSRGLALSTHAHATILAARDGPDVVALVAALRDRVQRAGGHVGGVVLTGCAAVPADAPSWR